MGDETTSVVTTVKCELQLREWAEQIKAQQEIVIDSNFAVNKLRVHLENSIDRYKKYSM